VHQKKVFDKDEITWGNDIQSHKNLIYQLDKELIILKVKFKGF